ncbi:oxygen-independent coproporphyrinogen-3 oxidase [Caulobacter ginsengisoli]|uniref:Coproporphyrinogen-III oxidase n=1 Tax=Caulobacter ginsengisoli TaxID=400775 RepID=A0ABU0IVC7_9CAUL|nr:oxygen-independent coproporphyrinogen III oxidase [Caulobacter ginsengisoli]MDQ0465967.1 oxygen-independent coproporphyrinogen-3 oxidase [Caulobacter ginsengisoli]
MTAQPAQTAAPSPAELVARYDGRAPRYTSYPTAVQFTPAVTPAVYRDWLAALPVDEAVSVYVHIPFCTRLCWFCGCNTRAVNRHEPVSAYLGRLVEELALLEAALPGRMTLNGLHLGGGTPNTLSRDDLNDLFRALRHVFRFTPNPRIAAELDPAGLTRDWVRAAAFHGLNRASLGVQNLSPQVQAAVNRRESFEEIANCVAWLREAEVQSINLDLMYGLPHQTLANTLDTVGQVVSLRPERIALFGYAHVPWMKSHQQLIDTAALPGPDARLEQAEVAAERLVGEGYVRIGLDHFALPGDELARAQAEGRLRRNFQGYTDDPPQTLIGLGASAIGSLPQGFVQNAHQELAWTKAVGQGQLPVARGVALTDDDRFRSDVIKRLMCDLFVDLAAVCARHGRDPSELSAERAALAPFEADGLVRQSGDRIEVTEAGRPLIRSVCALFDRYFEPEGGRHSKAL